MKGARVEAARRAGEGGPGARGGVALMLAVWILLVLGFVSLEVLAQVRARVDSASWERSRAASRYAAESGVVAVQALLDELVRGAATDEGDLSGVYPALVEEVTAWGERPLGSARFQVAVEDLNARVDLNRSRPELVQGLLAQFTDTERARILAERLTGGEHPPLMHLEEFQRVPGAGDSLAAAVAPYVTVWGDGRINANTAPVEVLAAVPNVGAVAARTLAAARAGGTLRSRVAVYSTLAEGQAGAVDSRLPDLVTEARRVLVVSRGWDSGHPYTHEVQVVLEILTSGLVTGPRVRVHQWMERGR